MKLEFKDIYNKHKNIPANVICLGGSLSKYRDEIEHNSDNKITLSLNLWFKHINKIPDYWLFANPSVTIKAMYGKIIKYRCGHTPCIIYADSVDLTDKNEVKNYFLKDIDYIGYDQRHFNNKPCLSGVYYQDGKICCGHIENNRLTIQEELQRFTGYSKRYSPGDTAGLHVISSAILLGCNPIIVYGMDLDYRTGYAQVINNDISDLSYDITIIPPPNMFDCCISNIRNDLDIIINSAKNIGIDVIRKT